MAGKGREKGRSSAKAVQYVYEGIERGDADVVAGVAMLEEHAQTHNIPPATLHAHTSCQQC